MLEIGTYEKSYRGLNMEDGQFFSITTERRQFRIAVNISEEFDWLSIFRDKGVILTSRCNTLLTNQIHWLFYPGVPGSNPVQILYFYHVFIHLFVTDFVHKKLSVIVSTCTN